MESGALTRTVDVVCCVAAILATLTTLEIGLEVATIGALRDATKTVFCVAILITVALIVHRIHTEEVSGPTLTESLERVRHQRQKIGETAVVTAAIEIVSATAPAAPPAVPARPTGADRGDVHASAA